MTQFHLVKRNPKKNGVDHRQRSGRVWCVKQAPAGNTP